MEKWPNQFNQLKKQWSNYTWIDNNVRMQFEKKILGRIGVAWVVKIPGENFREPVGWEVEIIDTPIGVSERSNSLLKWLKNPPPHFFDTISSYDLSNPLAEEFSFSDDTRGSKNNYIKYVSFHSPSSHRMSSIPENEHDIFKKGCCHCSEKFFKNTVTNTDTQFSSDENTPAPKLNDDQTRYSSDYNENEKKTEGFNREPSKIVARSDRFNKNGDTIKVRSVQNNGYDIKDEDPKTFSTNSENEREQNEGTQRKLSIESGVIPNKWNDNYIVQPNNTGHHVLVSKKSIYNIENLNTTEKKSSIGINTNETDDTEREIKNYNFSGNKSAKKSETSSLLKEEETNTSAVKYRRENGKNGRGRTRVPSIDVFDDAILGRGSSLEMYRDTGNNTISRKPDNDYVRLNGRNNHRRRYMEGSQYDVDTMTDFNYVPYDDESDDYIDE